MKPPRSRWAMLRAPSQESVAFFLVSYQDALVEMVKNEKGEVRVYKSRQAAADAAEEMKVVKPGIIGMSAEGYERFRREQRHVVEE